MAFLAPLPTDDRGEPRAGAGAGGGDRSSRTDSSEKPRKKNLGADAAGSKKTKHVPAVRVVIKEELKMRGKDAETIVTVLDVAGDMRAALF